MDLRHDRYLIVGLGNPGKKYQSTRHNIGFRILDHLATKFGLNFTRQDNYFAAEIELKQSLIILIKPTTFMNLSGKAVADVIKKYGVDFSNVLIVCDDFNLPLGRIRIRSKGSSGGHNGLSSIIESLNSIDFSRLRIGIAGQADIGDAVDFVLSTFDSSEEKQLKLIIEVASNCIEHFIYHGVNSAMNEFNRLLIM
ncbi:MAG TPA: aminoacyl-tRNA hydrolase [bacterium]|nr:aminoacyl-tRNA hydrolase [bacterium]